MKSGMGIGKMLQPQNRPFCVDLHATRDGRVAQHTVTSPRFQEFSQGFSGVSAGRRSSRARRGFLTLMLLAGTLFAIPLAAQEPERAC